MKNRLAKIWSWVKKIALAWLILSVVSVVAFRFVPVPFTPTMVFNSVGNLFNGNSMIWKYSWEPIENISPQLPKAIIAAEDQQFLVHNGFDFKAMQNAWKHNARRKKVRGGSTMSQQVAKNVFLWQGRSYFRKGLEAYFTVLIELFWGKKRIVEVYMNVAEMGTNIYGAEACAKQYFKKNALMLTKSESAYIAAILPSPKRWNPAKPTGYISKRKQWIVRQMNNLGNDFNKDL